MKRFPLVRPSALALLLAAAPAFTQQIEDAEHRADRLRTIELNKRAQSAVAHRDRGNADAREAGRAAQQRYEREVAEWRRRVAACRAGEYSACSTR